MGKKYINENTKTWLEGTLVQSLNLFRWPEPLRKHPRQLLRRLRSQNVTIVMSGKYRVRLNFRFFYFSGCITIVYIFYQYEFIHSYLWKKYICHHHQHHNHEHNYEDWLADMELILEILCARNALAANFESSLIRSMTMLRIMMVMMVVMIMVKKWGEPWWWLKTDVMIIQCIADDPGADEWSQPGPGVHSDDPICGHPLAVHLHHHHHHHHCHRYHIIQVHHHHHDDDITSTSAWIASLPSSVSSPPIRTRSGHSRSCTVLSIPSSSPSPSTNKQ